MGCVGAVVETAESVLSLQLACMQCLMGVFFCTRKQVAMARFVQLSVLLHCC